MPTGGRQSCVCPPFLILPPARGWQQARGPSEHSGQKPLRPPRCQQKDAAPHGRACLTLTLLSSACGTSASRGSATSSSWPGTGQAGRPPVSPQSGPASRTGRVLWSSSRSTPRRSRCCWLGTHRHTGEGGNALLPALSTVCPMRHVYAVCPTTPCLHHLPHGPPSTVSVHSIRPTGQAPVYTVCPMGPHPHHPSDRLGPSPHCLSHRSPSTSSILG